MRIGIGYDIHRLKKGRRLVLGGVAIPFPKGPLAHSDGDVIMHAGSDAILGALGLGDIGRHFPDTNAAYKDIASSAILAKVKDMMDDAGMKVNNMDIMLVLERPRISPFVSRMRRRTASILGVRAKAVNIKATTSEGLGVIGKGEAVAAYAVVSLKAKRV